MIPVNQPPPMIQTRRDGWRFDHNQADGKIDPRPIYEMRPGPQTRYYFDGPAAAASSTMYNGRIFGPTEGPGGH